jgi:hypothetical protein
MLMLIFNVSVEPIRFASSVATSRGYKASGRSCATYIFPHNRLPASFPTAKKKER